MYYKIFITFLLLDLSSSCLLFEFISNAKLLKNVQPTGHINYKVLDRLKKYTNFALEKKGKNSTFGKIFLFSTLSYCDNIYNKNLAIQCLQNKLLSWWCVYDICISNSKPKFHYIKISLPAVYKDNNITDTCDLII